MHPHTSGVLHSTLWPTHPGPSFPAPVATRTCLIPRVIAHHLRCACPPALVAGSWSDRGHKDPQYAICTASDAGGPLPHFVSIRYRMGAKLTMQTSRTAKRAILSRNPAPKQLVKRRRRPDDLCLHSSTCCSCRMVFAVSSFVSSFVSSIRNKNMFRTVKLSAHRRPSGESDSPRQSHTSAVKQAQRLQQEPSSTL